MPWGLLVRFAIATSYRVLGLLTRKYVKGTTVDGKKEMEKSIEEREGRKEIACDGSPISLDMLQFFSMIGMWRH